jgi:hypothetical protein
MLEGLQPPKKIPSCKVRTVLESLEPKDREILKAALVDPEWHHITLSQELTKRGIFISEHPMRRHRIGSCSCDA